MAVPVPDATLLWLTNVDALPEATLKGFVAWLGEGERLRCVRFARAERRRQFIAGRALLRLALGSLLGVPPHSIALRERPFNAPALEMPELELPESGVGFSISHSGPWVACAASTQAAVGLDIERIDLRRDALALAMHALGPEALARLRACEGAERAHAFYRMWCLHEARIKLGGPSAADYVFEQPGLALALGCDRPLPLAPVPRVVGLETLAAGAFHQRDH
ncbi:4'-phosphopantetheinyl transferase family protein [Massilia niabensis]|uniref:4'-phosphopantetheinyl transferase family protein n=1 Tax=Massilia niabensis TaxID=544910 RepID=A0ABW0L5U9_9BURK